MAMATATATITTTTVTAVHQDDIELERLDSGPSPATSPPDASTSLEGWLVLASCTTIFFVTLGLVYSFGVMQAVLISRKYASASTLGWVSSLVVVCVSGLALPCTAVVAHLGSRNTALIAGIMIGASQLATSFAFAAPVWTLFLAQGFFGIAYALAYWSTNALAAQYFERRRGLALGIVYAGSGIGGAVFSIALSQLERRYGLEWAVRIFAFLGWVTLLPAALAVKEKFRPTMKTFAWRYFKDTTFDLIFFATALSSFSLFVPPFFWPTFASAAGLSPSVGAYLVAGYNLASAAGRIGFGMLSDSRGPVSSLTLAMSLMGSTILGVWMIAGSNLGLLIFFLIINGACSGALLSLQPAMTASLYGTSEMSVTLGMMMSSRTLGGALGAPAAGFLLEASSGPDGKLTTASFRPALLLIGSILMASSMILLFVRFRLVGFDLKKRV